tara:strand:- start:709 stop:927 length:219 start_codon:yes stop_codon:yes gene_type:complete
MSKLKVTSVKYLEGYRGIAYFCKTNHDGIFIENRGDGGATMLQGRNSDCKPFRHLSESQLEGLIDEFEKQAR